MARPRRAALLALALAAACSGAPDASGPVPVAMSPSQGTGAGELPVLITGRGFDAASRTDFQKGSASLDASFSARLLPSGGGAPIALLGVRLTERRQLEARVPESVPRGTYALEVTAPTGLTGRLEQAFRVVTSAENVHHFRVEPAETAYAGIPFLLALTAVDATGLVVDGFSDTVQITDLTGTVAPTVSGPFALGRLSVRVTVSTLAAADQVTVVDPLGHAGSSAPFAVVAGPPVAVAFASAPLTVAVGACSPAVTLELRDRMGNPTQGAPLDLQLQSSPAGSLAFFSDAGCSAASSTLAISAGATGAAFHFRGSSPGPVELRAVPTGLPSVTQGAMVLP
jgi:hypothetical protein